MKFEVQVTIYLSNMEGTKEKEHLLALKGKIFNVLNVTVVVKSEF